MTRLQRIPRTFWLLVVAVGVLFLLLASFYSSQPAAPNPTPTPIPISAEEREELLAYARAVFDFREETFSLALKIQRWESSGEKTEEAFLPLYTEAQSLLERFQAVNPPQRAASVHSQFVGVAGTTKEALGHRLNELRGGGPQEGLAYWGLIQLARTQLSGAFGAFWSLYDSVGITVEEILGME